MARRLDQLVDKVKYIPRCGRRALRFVRADDCAPWGTLAEARELHHIMGLARPRATRSRAEMPKTRVNLNVLVSFTAGD
jgi:hypothetical protein